MERGRPGVVRDSSEGLGRLAASAELLRPLAYTSPLVEDHPWLVRTRERNGLELAGLSIELALQRALSLDCRLVGRQECAYCNADGDYQREAGEDDQCSLRADA